MSDDRTSRANDHGFTDDELAALADALVDKVVERITNDVGEQVSATVDTNRQIVEYLDSQKTRIDELESRLEELQPAGLNDTDSDSDELRGFQ